MIHEPVLYQYGPEGDKLELFPMLCCRVGKAKGEGRRK